MPIKVPNDLPAVKTLKEENIFVITCERAKTQDIRPLRILILNLMPTKIVTETQLLRCLANTPLQLEVEFLKISTHESKNTSREHLDSFYHTFEEIKNNKYDGLIITGAPVEALEFSQVNYIKELNEIFEWSNHNVFSSLFICWGAQAGLNYFYDIPKYNLDKKISGIYPHKIIKERQNIFRGFDDVFNIPHSRNSEIRLEDIKKSPNLEVLATSSKAGVSIVASNDNRKFFITGHLEYDRDTLNKEYLRDIEAGLNPSIPENYFENDDPSSTPCMTWKSHAHLFFSNWLNYYVYQDTPYNIEDIS